MFAKLVALFRSKPSQQSPAATRETPFVIAHLAARLQPVHREAFFGDPLDTALSRLKIGSVTGGGTELADDPVGISSCDIEISLNDVTEPVIGELITIFESLGAPKGSELRFDDRKPIPFGQMEGMAIYLNGTDLPPEIYKNSDINATLSNLSKALTDKGTLFSHWNGARSTALYYYGKRFEDMNEVALKYCGTDPLCSQCQIERIA